MGKVIERLRLAREGARQRRAVARRRWKNMSLRTAFVWYVLVAAVIATIVCAFFINALDEYRISLFLKYQSRSQELEVPEGGSHIAYVTTDGAEAYVIYDADGNIVARGKVPYGEGHIEVGIGEESA